MRNLVLGALLAAACALHGPPARGELVRAWTFEQPVFGRPSLWVTDHCLVKSGGLWHLFYTHRFTPEEPYDAIGHATSADRRHWTEHPPALVVEGGAPAWRSVEVWAPFVAAWPAGGWVMAFTGVNPDGSQQTGFLWSSDLETWAENPAVPPMTPDGMQYFWSPLYENDNRDPHLLRVGSIWHLFYATRTHAGVACVGHSSSPDLVNWTHYPPLLTAGGGWTLPDLESPGVVTHGGWHYLFYCYYGVRALRAPALTGPWQHADAHLLGPSSSGGELVPSGSGLTMSRIRISSCDPDRPILWFDSLDTSGWPLAHIPLTSLDEFPWTSGDAFTGAAQFGDPQAWRGEPPVEPSGLYWLSSREAGGEPFVWNPCSFDRGSGPQGELRSLPFRLDADTVRAELLAGVPNESVFVALRDACTHGELARLVPGGPTLAMSQAVVTPVRGRMAEWSIVDGGHGPGAWIGVDQLELRRQGSVNLGPGPVLGWTRPEGGEVYNPGDQITPRWTATHPAGLDSFYIYLVDHTSEDLTFLRKRFGSSRTFNWVLPVDTTMMDIRLRVVAFGKDKLVNCLDSELFHVVESAVAATPAEPPALAVERRGNLAHLVGRVPPEGGGTAVLEVFDVRGRRVATPWRGGAGESFAVPAPAADAAGRLLPRGVYFARLRAGERAFTVRFVRITAGR